MVKFNFLDWWFKPVEIVAGWLLDPLSRLVLPETSVWFR
jgi:hypothetical protein